MIYISAQISGKVPQTQAYANKKLSGLTQGRISDIILFGKPTYVQIAFSGYKDSIEAFLLATAVGMKVSTKAGHYPIPIGSNITVPLRFPPIVFKLSKVPKPEFVTALLERWEEYGVRRVEVGKGSPSFTMDSPTLSIIRDKLPAISLPRGPNIAGYCQLEAAVESIRIYQCVEFFLATNTYYYKKDIDEVMKKESPAASSTVASRYDLRYESGYFRAGYDADRERKEYVEGGSDDKVDALEPKNLTPHLTTVMNPSQAVLVAKPSPKPASTSFGQPSSVPAHPGILFPYFEGLLASDTNGLKELFTKYFFRNLGSGTVDAKAAYLTFRQVIGTFVHTEQGRIISHVLKGMELALETQTHLYLLFDGQTYLGFTLLGQHFSVFAHGKWVTPLEAQDLRAELVLLQTHSKNLGDLAARMRRCVDSGGDSISVEDDELTSMTRLGYLLSTIELREDENDEEEISAILARLSFPTRFKTFKPANIVWAIDQLTANLTEPIPDDLPIFIPLKGWERCGDKVYQVLASFGPRSFSFRNSSGVEIRIGKVSDTDHFSERDEQGQLKYGSFLVGEKVISEASKDWKLVCEKGSVKMDFKERAAGSRLHVFKDESLRLIWGKLREEVTAGRVAVGSMDTAKAEKRSHAVAFGAVGHDEFTF
jgi:hypothetical protein